MSTVSVKDLSFTYPNGKQVLRQLSFSLEKGELLLLCGKNGCGKSTLLRLLKKEVAPKGTLHGEITLSGQSAILFQECDKNIIFRSAYEDLIFPACNYALPEEQILKRAEKVLQLFGIERLKERETGTLSGGEKQLLSLASLMILQPEILLLDEPLSGLDEQAKAAFLQALFAIQESGTTILIAEHNTDILLEKSDKILLFEDSAASVCSKEAIAQATTFPNAPDYLLLEQQLGLPVQDITRAAAAKALSEHRNEILITPLARTEPTGESVLCTENLDFSYGTQPLLTSVHLHLHKGEVCFLCGKNGAGKSTLLSLLCGFLKPQQGNIRIGEGASLGYLAQNPVYSFFKDTLIEDFRFLLKQNKLPEARMEEMFKAYSLFADLKQLLHANPLDLSGGEREKAAIFKLLLLGRDIVLLDEPEKHIDKSGIRELSHIVRHLAQRGISFLVVSHSPELIYTTADSICELQAGICTRYRVEDYFPARCQTALYKAIAPAKLPLHACGEAQRRSADG